MTDEIKINKIPESVTNNCYSDFNLVSNPCNTDCVFEGSLICNSPIFDSFNNIPYFANSGCEFSNTLPAFDFSMPIIPNFSTFSNMMSSWSFSNIPAFESFSNWFKNYQIPAAENGTQAGNITASASNLLGNAKLTKPSVTISQKCKSNSHVPPAKTGKTVKAYSGKGFVDAAVSSTDMGGVTVHHFGGTNLTGLKLDLKNSIIELTKLAKEHGYILVISDGYRSIAEQAEAKRRKPDLCANAGSSPHNYGCAIDIALYKDWGEKPVDITRQTWFTNYAKGTLGLAWGQDWNSKKQESWHFERKGWNEPGSDVYSDYLAATGRTRRS